MDLSGIIFVVLAIAWAVYLIPKTLKQHDEVARTRSLDRFSGTLRVLARREPVNRRDSRLVVGPSVPATRSVTTVAPTGTPTVTTMVSPSTDAFDAETPPASSGSPARSRTRRTAAGAATRRRRRVLLVLLLCVALTAVTAYLSILPGWSVTVPVGLTVAYLALCRTLARQDAARRSPARLRSPRPGEPGELDEVRDASAVVEPPAPSESAEETVGSGSTAVQVDAADEHPVPGDQEDTVGIPVAEMHAELHDQQHAAPTTPSGTLWDPLPVTLPTYVTKPKARRTVRTIDLGEPGTWTSGRTVQDAEVAARVDSGEPAATEDGTGEAGRRAVGS